LEYLIANEADVKLRVTSIVFSEGVTILPEVDADDVFSIQWSVSPENQLTPWTNETVSAIVNRIPSMSDGDSVVIVETQLMVQPIFQVGVDDQQIDNFVVTRPRFMPKICLLGTAC
jgi:hypothetical protein